MNIISFFHACDNSVRNDDKLYKVGPILSIPLPAWKKAYYPDREICLDESIIAFKGRAPGRVYQPKKPHKWGLRVYMLAESNSGYCYKLEIYAGRGLTMMLTEKSVVSPMPLSCAWHVHALAEDTTYVNNYYTSPQVRGDLLLNYLGACGILRVSRKGVLPLIRHAKL